jgi:hypothetical protein
MPTRGNFRRRFIQIENAGLAFLGLFWASNRRLVGECAAYHLTVETIELSDRSGSQATSRPHW